MNRPLKKNEMKSVFISNLPNLFLRI